MLEQICKHQNYRSVLNLCFQKPTVSFRFWRFKTQPQHLPQWRFALTELILKTRSFSKVYFIFIQSNRTMSFWHKHHHYPNAVKQTADNRTEIADVYHYRLFFLNKDTS